MAGFKRCVGFAWVAFFLVGAGPVTLVESNRLGSCSKVTVGLKAEGLYRPSPPPGAAKGDFPKPLALKVETRLEFVERLWKSGGQGEKGADVAVRRVYRAASAINGEVRPSSAVLRPEVGLLLAEPKVEGVVVTSLGGPLTRSELELVQAPGDPLSLAPLLPVRPVELGDRWKVGESAARGLSAYDSLKTNGLQATLTSVDDNRAVVQFKGVIRGNVLGAEGTMTCEGTYTFDRKASRISELTVDRSETRVAGPVEAGLDMKSKLTVNRADAPTPKELTDEVLDTFSTKPDPNRELLLLTLSEGKATLIHDRSWHTYWDDVRLTVLKRLEGNDVVAQCNLSTGPNAGKGRHQDIDQFRADIKKGLAGRFSQFLGAGELEAETDTAVGFRYKVGVQGKQGDLGVIWYYYLLAGPEGDQLLGTFTLAANRFQSFGDNDERLMGSIHWITPTSAAAASGSP